MTVEVVPVLRLRRNTTTWSYQVPRHLTLLPGHLVVVPFRNRPTIGVVWRTDETSDQATASVERLLCQAPLVYQPHRQLIEWLAETGLCSLSSALFAWLPRSLRELPYTRATQALLTAHSSFTTTPLYSAEHKQHLILVPGKRPSQERSLATKYGESFVRMFTDISEQEELAHWLAIARGEARVSLGGERAIWAPYLNVRHITVVEPEDIHHYHEQRPYLNLIDAATALAQFSGATLDYRSHLPTSAAQELWGEQASGLNSSAPQVQMVDLTREPLINTFLIQEIQKTVAAKQHTLLLLNAHDSLTAPDPTKGNLRTLRPGIEAVRKQLAHHLNLAELPPEISLGTRSILTERPRNLGLTVALNIDHLLENPLFADQLHGWSDLSTLLSFPCKCIIQSHYPAHPLTWACANGTFTTYITERIAQRKAHALPPFGQQVVCSLAVTEESESEAQKLYEILEPLLNDSWQISHPFNGVWRKKPYLHLLLSAPVASRIPLPLREALSTIEKPWKVESNPWHIM